MLRSIRLTNYQSHKDTILEFSPGVNVITGKSRSGKTAVLRGLVGNRYNKFGLAMNSYWNRNKKKEAISASSVEVTFEDVSITRTRGPELNGYIMSNKSEPYAATRTEVPEDIDRIWNMGDVNIQKQFDQIFLLSDGQTEVARFLNKTIKLDKIDEVLSKAETKRIGANKDIKKLEVDLESLNKFHSEMAWIDCVSVKIGRAERIEQKVQNAMNEKVNLFDLFASNKYLLTRIEKIPDNLDGVLLDIAEAEKFDQQIQNKEDKWSTLQNIIEHAVYDKIKVDSIPDFTDVETLIASAESFDRAIEQKVDIESNLKDLMLDIRQQQREIKNLPDEDRLLKMIISAELFKYDLDNKFKKLLDFYETAKAIRGAEKEMKKETDLLHTLGLQFPDVCPLCERPLEACNDRV